MPVPQQSPEKILASLSPEELAFLEEQMREQEAKMKAKREQMLGELGTSIQAKFEARLASRTLKEQEWLTNMRMYIGSVANNTGTISKNPDRPFIPGSASNVQVEFNVVREKCDIAIAQLVSMQFGGGEKNWDIQPSPLSKDPLGNPVETAVATQAAESMEKTIHDQLNRCDYGAQSRMAIKDRVILGTGILKGPRNALQHKKRYKNIGGIGKAYLELERSPSVVRVNPWFFFPDDTVVDIDHAEDAIEVHPMTHSKLFYLAQNSEAFAEFKDVIFEVLQEAPKEIRGASYTDSVDLTGNYNAYKNKYPCIEYHGPIERKVLDVLDIDPSYESPNDIYYAEVWVVHGRVIRFELETIDACYSVPYAVCTWEDDPSSIFGIGLPALVRDQQKVIISTYQMILDNAAASAGPQVVISDNVEPEDGDLQIRPFKIWRWKEGFNEKSVSDAFQFFDVPNNGKNLQPVLEMARQFAEEESGIPLIQGGLQSPQVGESATGMALIQQASTTVLDYKNESWDDRVTEKVISWFHDWNWEYNPDPSIKGDFEIDVRSSSEYRNKLMHIKNLEKLSVEVTQNEVLSELINMDELQRARLMMMNLPAHNIVKSPEEIEQLREQKAQQGPTPEQLEYETKMAELEVKKAELAFKTQELQFRQQEEQARIQLEYEERMASQAARVQEAHASVLSEQLRFQTELLKLAQKEDSDRGKLMAMLETTRVQEETKKFLKGIDAANDAREQMLKMEEIKVKRETGKGALNGGGY